MSGTREQQQKYSWEILEEGTELVEIEKVAPSKNETASAATSEAPKAFTVALLEGRTRSQNTKERYVHNEQGAVQKVKSRSQYILPNVVITRLQRSNTAKNRSDIPSGTDDRGVKDIPESDESSELNLNTTSSSIASRVRMRNNAAAKKNGKKVKNQKGSANSDKHNHHNAKHAPDDSRNKKQKKVNAPDDQSDKVKPAKNIANTAGSKIVKPANSAGTYKCLGKRKENTSKTNDSVARTSSKIHKDTNSRRAMEKKKNNATAYQNKLKNAKNTGVVTADVKSKNTKFETSSKSKAKTQASKRGKRSSKNRKSRKRAQPNKGTATSNKDVTMTIPGEQNEVPEQMVEKPKTIKDVQKNRRVMNAISKNHKDDIFNTKVNEKQNNGKGKNLIKVNIALIFL